MLERGYRKLISCCATASIQQSDPRKYTASPVATSGCTTQWKIRLHSEAPKEFTVPALSPDLISKCPETTNRDEALNGIHQRRSRLWRSPPPCCPTRVSIGKGPATTSDSTGQELIRMADQNCVIGVVRRGRQSP